MYASGSGLMAGSGWMGTVPAPTTSVRYSFEPRAKKRITSPFRSAEGVLLPIKTSTPKPLPVEPKKKAPTVKRKPAARRAGTTPRHEVPSIKAAREYLSTPKVCEACGNEFTSREGERIDGYRRRQTCDRKCARNLRNTKKEEA